jgi:hypothetical protein
MRKLHTNIWLVFMFIYIVYTVNVDWDSVVDIATCAWMAWGLNVGGSEIFCTHPDQPWSPPSLSVQWAPGLFPGR